MRWQSAATLPTLRKSAEVRHLIRTHMHERGVLEVVTPVLSAAAAIDPGLDSFVVSEPRGAKTRGYLQTSPEFPMKRLLAQFGHDIYQIAPVFRADERGRAHNTEFTLLEWYRLGFDEWSLIQDVSVLLDTLFVAMGRPWRPPAIHRYGELVRCCTGQFPEELDTRAIQAIFAAHHRSWPASIGDDHDAALNLLVDEFVLPKLAADCASFIVDYPPSQAALARLGTHEGRLVARRFEVYVGTLELANGYLELQDADEQRRRFVNDGSRRRACAAPEVPHDEHLLEALAHGLPDCAGVALGVERLLMLLCGKRDIREVMSFTHDNA